MNRTLLFLPTILYLIIVVSCWVYPADIMLIVWVIAGVLGPITFLVVVFKSKRLKDKLILAPFLLFPIFDVGFELSLKLHEELDTLVYGDKIFVATDDEIFHSVSEYVVIRSKDGHLNGQCKFSGTHGYLRYQVILSEKDNVTISFRRDGIERNFLLKNPDSLRDLTRKKTFYVVSNKLKLKNDMPNCH